jgi:hypothetical protein
MNEETKRIGVNDNKPLARQISDYLQSCQCDPKIVV